MPDWIKEAGPTAAVAIASIYLFTKFFIKTFEKWGASRDEERDKFLAVLKGYEERAQRQTEAFTGAIVMLVSLAHTMVTKCQPGKKNVTVDQITAAAQKTMTKVTGGNSHG